MKSRVIVYATYCCSSASGPRSRRRMPRPSLCSGYWTGPRSKSSCARYVTALDTLDADAYEGVFTEDGEYDANGYGAQRSSCDSQDRHRPSGEPRTEPGGRGGVAAALPRDGELLDRRFSTPTNARHQSYAQTVRLADNGQFVVGFMGRYEDVLVKVRRPVVDPIAQARVVHSARSDFGGQ